MTQVTHFPLPPEKALNLIRKAASGKGNVFLPERSGEGEWEKLVVDRQIQRCLEDGKIISGPEPNELGHLEYQMQRVSAGIEITITVALFKDEDDWVAAVRRISTDGY